MHISGTSGGGLPDLGRMRVLAVSQDSDNVVGFYAGFYVLVRALARYADVTLLMKKARR